MYFLCTHSLFFRVELTKWRYLLLLPEIKSLKRSDPISPQRLLREVERTKRVLRSTHQARVEFEALCVGHTVSRARFDELNNDPFKIVKVLQAGARGSSFKDHHIDKIVLVGGSTRTPKVPQFINIDSTVRILQRVSACQEAARWFPPLGREECRRTSSTHRSTHFVFQSHAHFDIRTPAYWLKCRALENASHLHTQSCMVIVLLRAIIQAW